MNADLESAPGALEAWHRQHGAQWRENLGRRIVGTYGDVASELAVLRQGWGLIEQRWVEGFVVSGEDRRRFLNGYLTCDVASLEPGGGAYGFFTSAQGRVLADAVVTASEEGLRVDVADGRSGPLIEHLSRYILADRVEIRAESPAVRWLLVGAEADSVAERLGAQPPRDLWSTVTHDLAGAVVAIRRERALGPPVLGLRVAAAEAAAVADALLALGARPVGFDAIEVLRLEAGVPRYGADFDEAHFPQEIGFDDAVSYTKGCYLGQEVVARIHYRGHVNHQLCGLRIDGNVVLVPGAVEFEGQEVGRLGSAAFSSALGGTIALAVLHRKAAASGTQVLLAAHEGQVETRIEARVEEPGFAAVEIVGAKA